MSTSEKDSYIEFLDKALFNLDSKIDDMRLSQTELKSDVVFTKKLLENNLAVMNDRLIKVEQDIKPIKKKHDAYMQIKEEIKNASIIIGTVGVITGIIAGVINIIY